MRRFRSWLGSVSWSRLPKEGYHEELYLSTRWGGLCICRRTRHWEGAGCLHDPSVHSPVHVIFYLTKPVECGTINHNEESGMKWNGRYNVNSKALIYWVWKPPHSLSGVITGLWVRNHWVLPENYISGLGVRQEGRSSPLFWGADQQGPEYSSRVLWELNSKLSLFPQRDRSIKVGWPTVKVLYISVGVQVASVPSLGKRGP